MGKVPKPCALTSVGQMTVFMPKGLYDKQQMNHESQVSKFIVFKITDYLLALPLSNVLKVVNYSVVGEQTGTPLLRTMGIVQLGKHTIRLLKLQQYLSSDGLPQIPLKQPFLLIVQIAMGELCGIWLEEPPNLLELHNETLRIIPKSERQSGALEIISHAAVLSENNVTTTIFLLDLQLILKTTIQV
jgi:purine-binding chemotaxis protein CheW